MFKKKAIQITVIVAIITIISVIIVAATYAGYAGIIGQSSDIAYIARWNISMNSNENFFKHDYILNLVNKDNNGKYVIAPGVSGNSEIILKNTGDVKANVVNISITKANETLNVPLVFSIDNENWTSLDNSSINLNSQIIGIGESKTVATIYWKWPSEGNDVLDTIVGISSAKGNNSFTLNVSVTAEQLME